MDTHKTESQQQARLIKHKKSHSHKKWPQATQTERNTDSELNTICANKTTICLCWVINTANYIRTHKYRMAPKMESLIPQTEIELTEM